MYNRRIILRFNSCLAHRKLIRLLALAAIAALVLDLVDQLPTETNSDNCLSPPMFENDNESHNEGKYFLLHKH